MKVDVYNISTITREPVQFPVSAVVAGVAFDVTVLPVSFAEVPQGVKPADTDFAAGTWAKQTTPQGPVYWATYMIPTGPVGRRDLYLRVSAAPAQPTRHVAVLVRG